MQTALGHKLPPLSDARWGDPRWRILDSGLYTTLDRVGNIVPFIGNEAQRYLFDNQHDFSVVLKSRQIGSTTLWGIVAADTAFFYDNKQIVLIAENEDRAIAIRKAKIEFPYSYMPAELREQVRETRNVEKEWALSNGSRVIIGYRQRGSTFQMVLATEVGQISAEFQKKAEELIGGTIQACHLGAQPDRYSRPKVILESTNLSYGGVFTKLCWEGLPRIGKPNVAPADPKLIFFPWWRDSKCTDPHALDPPLTPQEADIEAGWRSRGLNLTEHQTNFWMRKRRVLSLSAIGQEYPTTPEDALVPPPEGAMFSDEMERAERSGRLVKHLKPWEGLRVDTGWDLGLDRHLVVWFGQKLLEERKLLAFSEFPHCTLEMMVRHVRDLFREHNWVMGRHFVPHDAVHRDQGRGTTRLSVMRAGGLRPTLLAKSSVEDDQVLVRKALPLCRWNLLPTLEGVKHIRLVSQQKNRIYGDFVGSVKDDKHGHGYDALRYLFRGQEKFSVSMQSQNRRKRQLPPGVAL